jgi:4-amino-4-deoxy-L-arabinose transferase-like glycosyltransferase
MKLLIFFEKKALVFILVLFLVIASAGIFFNYSLFNTTGDEAPLISAVLKMIADHSLRPNYPSFYHLSLGAFLYLPFFLIWLLLMRFSGIFPNMEVIKQFGQVDFAKFLPLARFISVLAGLACLYLLYKICEKLFNNKFVSLTATFFLATSLLFVQASHFARIWVPQVLTILLAFYFIIILYQTARPKLKNYLLCGLGVGLAFGTHAVGVLIYCPFLAAHYLKNKSEKIKNIIFNKYFWLANLIFVLIYFSVYYFNTYGFAHYLGGVLPNFGKVFFPSHAFSSTVSQTEILVQHNTSTFIGVLFYYLNALWQYETLLLLLAVFGSLILFIKKREIFIIIYSFAAVYFFVISSLGAGVARYILPIIPFMAIVAAYGLAWLYDKAKNKKIAGSLIGILFVLFLYPPLLWDYKFILPSSRLEAVNWVYKNLPSNESIINLDSGLELNENRQSLQDVAKYSNFLTKKRAYLLNSADSVFSQPNYYVFFYPHYEQVPPEILKKKFNYLIISWWNKNNFEDNLDKLKNLNLTEKNLVLLKRFPAEADENSIGFDMGGSIDKPLFNLSKLKQNGPIVDIYKIN